MQVEKIVFSPWYLKVRIKKIKAIALKDLIQGVFSLFFIGPKLIQRNGPGQNEWIEAPHKNYDSMKVM